VATLVLTANRGGAVGGVTIQNNGASDTGYSMVGDPDWGMIDPAFVISASPDGVGRLAQQQVTPRQVVIPIRVRGTSKAVAVSLVSALADEAAACARSGGVLKWQSNNATYPVYLRVQAAKYVVPQGWHWETHNRADGVLGLVCDPYAYGDAMGFVDRYDTDTSANYTATTGAGTMAISAGKLVPSTTAQKSWQYTGNGYSYTDCQVTIKIQTGGAVAGGTWEVGLTNSGGTVFQSCYYVQATGNPVVRGAYGAGSATKASGGASAVAANTTYWLRFRREGMLCTAEWFTSEPTPTTAAASTATYVHTPTEAAQALLATIPFFAFLPNNTSERYDDFEVKPFTYKQTMPSVMRLAGIPGDADASCTIDVTQASGVATAATWGGVFWGERAAQASLVANGNFDVDSHGWQITSAGAGLNSAATNFTRDTSVAKYGSASSDVIATAISGSGVAYAMYQPFKRGRTYLALGWHRSSTAVDLAAIRIGIVGDTASGPNITLSTAWQLTSAAWQPAADTGIAYFCSLHQSAAIATYQIDAMQVFEVEPTSLSAAITTAGQTSLTLNAIPASGNPAVPFLALCESELVRVTAVSGTTWTIERGAEGSTAATHVISSVVYPLPGYLAGDYQDGTLAPSLPCIVEAESAASVSNWSVSADANASAGFKLLGAAATTFQAKWEIDPGLFVSPMFGNDEALIEVWARVEMSASLTAPRLTLSVSSEDGTAFGAQRYDLENGSQGIPLTLPSGTVFRFVRLGVVSVPVVSGAQRRRMYLTLDGTTTSAVAGFNIDYLVLATPNRRATSPTGVASSAPYQAFMPSTGQTTRGIRSDLLSTIASPPKAPAAAAGVVGAPLVLPAPNADVLVKLSSLVPNDASTVATSETPVTYTPVVSINPTPRYFTIR
jgi:hypothetical protein